MRYPTHNVVIIHIFILNVDLIKLTEIYYIIIIKVVLKYYNKIVKGNINIIITLKNISYI